MPQQSKHVALGAAVGSFGSDYVDDTDTHTVDLNYENTTGGGTTYHQGFKAWSIIEAVTDTVFNSITYHADHDGDNWDTADTFSAGDKIRGLITSIDLTSGTVRCHRV